jgi:hypothetical protein
MIPGDPILDEFDPFPAAGPLPGVTQTPFYSTMAEIEIQFSLLTSTDPVLISSIPFDEAVSKRFSRLDH